MPAVPIYSTKINTQISVLRKKSSCEKFHKIDSKKTFPGAICKYYRTNDSTRRFSKNFEKLLTIAILKNT